MKAEYVRLRVRNGILPRLVFTVSLTAQHDSERYVVLLRGDLYIESKEGIRLICSTPLPSDSTFYYLELNKPRNVEISFRLTPRTIEVMEKFRGGGDLWLRLSLCIKTMRDISSLGELFVRDTRRIDVAHREYGALIKVARSDWVEKYLPELNYKRIRIIEVPLLELIPEEFKQVPVYLEEAWKCYFLGDYDDVMSNCRRVMMAIASGVRNLNCKKVEVNEKGERKTVPDWKKFFGRHETLSENFEKMFRGLYGFLQPGSHIGRAISRPEAECALMSTYSLANYVIKTALKYQSLN